MRYGEPGLHHALCSSPTHITHGLTIYGSPFGEVWQRHRGQDVRGLLAGQPGVQVTCRALDVLKGNTSPGTGALDLIDVHANFACQLSYGRCCWHRGTRWLGRL